MKRTIAVAAGALALLGLALLVRPPGTARKAPPSVAKAAAAETAPVHRAAEIDLPAPDALVGTLAAIRAKLRLHAGGAPYAPGELEEVMALEREAQARGAALARAVAASPDGGREAVARLLGIDDEDDSLRIARMIAGAVGAPARSHLAELLAGAGSLRERRVAVVILAADGTQAGLVSLLHAAQSDDDASIRSAALRELQSRACRRPDEAPMIREVAATRAACEPDETARRAALAASQPPPGVEGRFQSAARRGR